MNLYLLKRQHAACIDLYQKTAYAPDYETGSKGIQTKHFELTQAIVLPKNINFESLVQAASKNQTYSADQIFIIDANDLPDNWTISLNDWIIYKKLRFDITRIVPSDICNGIIIYTKQINSVVGRTIDISLVDYVRTSQDVII